MTKFFSPEITASKLNTAFPPGRLKIVKALRDLLEEKKFSAITGPDITATAGVDGGLSYKYFKDTGNLRPRCTKNFSVPIWTA